MAYAEISASIIKAGKAVSITLLNLLRTNFDDHQTRIVALEGGQLFVPPGLIIPHGSTVAPAGYLNCDGSAINRVTYASLFAIIGTTYNIGGEAGTDFRVPNLCGRAPIGVGTGSGLTARALADSGGEESHALSTAEIPAHAHGVNDPGHTHTWPNVIPNTAGGNTFVGIISENLSITVSNLANQNSATGVSVNNSGSGTAHNNMQPSCVTNFIIKT